MAARKAAAQGAEPLHRIACMRNSPWPSTRRSYACARFHARARATPHQLRLPSRCSADLLTMLQALLWRQWLVKSRSRISTLVEVLSPILLMSIMVYAYWLVEPKTVPRRIYANQTAELVYNISRDAAASQLASDLRLCSAILQPPAGNVGDAHEQQAAAQPEDGAVVPPGRRLRQQTTEEQGGDFPAGVAANADSAGGSATAAGPEPQGLAGREPAGVSFDPSGAIDHAAGPQPYQQLAEYPPWAIADSAAPSDAGGGPAASVSAAAPLSAQDIGEVIAAMQGGVPSGSALAPEVAAAVAFSPEAAIGQISPGAESGQGVGIDWTQFLTPSVQGVGIDWTQFLTPSVLAAALKLAQNPLDGATWQYLLQSGAGTLSIIALRLRWGCSLPTGNVYAPTACFCPGSACGSVAPMLACHTTLHSAHCRNPSLCPHAASYGLVLQSLIRQWFVAVAELGQRVVAQALGGTSSTPEQQAKFQDCAKDALLRGGVGAPRLATQLLQGFLRDKG